MTNKLPALLAELSEIAPEICRQVNDEYIMQGFVFFVDKKVGLTATLFESNGTISGSATGNPAYDWLQGALMRVIEGKGWYWELRYSKPRNRYQAEIANHTVWNNDATEALLIAFITALKGEQ